MDYCNRLQGFPDSSVGKESACHAGDSSSIPGSGRSHPLQYSWASLVAQLVKNLPAMQGTWVQSLGWDDPLEKAMATHPSILAWRIPWTVQSMGSESQTRLSDFTLLHLTTSRFTIIMPREFHGLNLLNYSLNNIFTEKLSYAIVFKVGKTTPKKTKTQAFPCGACMLKGNLSSEQINK